MTVFVDADACPVTEIAIRLCRENGTRCVLICDTAHEMRRDGAETVTVDQGADSADFRLVNLAKPGDLVVTQDYGLAAMCLGKGARVLHQDGWAYTADNIDALLLARHEARKRRAAGGHLRGPKKRTVQQDQAFEAALRRMLTREISPTAPDPAAAP